jgi:ribonuclease VapC
MFVDASALVSILLEEEDVLDFATVLNRSRSSVVTPFVVMETGLAVTGKRPIKADRAYAEIEATLSHFGIRTIALTSDMILAALQAYERYGKGRSHSAKLNMGDCLSYGAARVLGVPLLYKGEDFAKTDIRSALA